MRLFYISLPLMIACSDYSMSDDAETQVIKTNAKSLMCSATCDWTDDFPIIVPLEKPLIGTTPGSHEKYNFTVGSLSKKINIDNHGVDCLLNLQQLSGMLYYTSSDMNEWCNPGKDYPDFSKTSIPEDSHLHFPRQNSRNILVEKVGEQTCITVSLKYKEPNKDWNDFLSRAQCFDSQKVNLVVQHKVNKSKN